MKRMAGMAVIAAALVAAPASAGIDGAGTAAASFLSIGTGPAVLAMGGAAIGRAGTLDLAAWNTGSLGFVDATSLALAHASLDDQAMQEWASLGGPIGKVGTHWALSALYQSEGSFEGRDASNISTGAFSVSSAAGSVMLAQSFGKVVSVGVGGKYVLDNLGPSARGNGYTFDAGLAVRAGMLGLGFAAQNVGGQMTYAGVGYPFPTNVGGGISLTHARTGLTVACDVNAPSTSYTNVRTGLEWSLKQHVALRAGYRMDMGAASGDALTGPTFGTGLGTKGVWLDYAFLLTGNEGGQHRLAISLHPGHLGMHTGDPFGQTSMPSSFDDPMIGPPVPKATTGNKDSKKR